MVEQKFPDLAAPEAIAKYFDWLYHAKDAILDKKKIVELSGNGKYATIGQQFKLIEDHRKMS